MEIVCVDLFAKTLNCIAELCLLVKEDEKGAIVRIDKDAPSDGILSDEILEEVGRVFGGDKKTVLAQIIEWKRLFQTMVGFACMQEFFASCLILHLNDGDNLYIQIEPACKLLWKGCVDGNRRDEERLELLIKFLIRRSRGY